MSPCRPQHRRRRKRYAQEGMLVQIDGSPHDWLEERRPLLHLLAAIDDATGKVLVGVIRSQDDRVGYFQLVHSSNATGGLWRSIMIRNCFLLCLVPFGL
jgi:hypothetical protein